MKKHTGSGNGGDYKVLMTELGSNPLRMVRVAFALMGIIPFLAIVYAVVGKHCSYDLLLGNSGLIIVAAIFISIMGFFLAYNIVNDMVKRLMTYASEHKDAGEKSSISL